ncbi:hypothetical protein [Glaciibacter superstes]|uniref:hypothetical protein n=1 Tax=Glaciibacter superstes TaxID=501023 RepID=UPI0003B65863|nr:hypothetical protein [Glaciibacter superstes]
MTILAPLILAGVLIVLLRAAIIRQRRIRLGLPVRGPWHFPRWLRALPGRAARVLRRFARGTPPA